MQHLGFVVHRSNPRRTVGVVIVRVVSKAHLRPPPLVPRGARRRSLRVRPIEPLHGELRSLRARRVRALRLEISLDLGTGER